MPHGGLNDESASMDRISVLGPYFKANGIYPLFITWKSGLLETLANILKDAIGRPQGRRLRTEGWRDVFDDIGERISEANDYTWRPLPAAFRPARCGRR